MSLYYSQRSGRGPLGNPGLEELARLLTLTIEEMRVKEHLQEWFGKDCVDDPDSLGRAGVPIADYIEMETGRVTAWPLAHPFVPDDPELDLEPYEDWLFDLIEFFFLHVSQGEGGTFHQYDGCGWHYDSFEPLPARELLLRRMNRLLPF